MQITETNFLTKYLSSSKKNMGIGASPTPDYPPAPPSSQSNAPVDTTGLLRTQAALQSAQTYPQIIDSLDLLTPSDRALFKSVTGVDCVDMPDFDTAHSKISAYDAADLEFALVAMRIEHGADSSPLTAKDVSKFIYQFQSGQLNYKVNVPVLEKTMEALSSIS
jgi:hypothetical protein